MGLGLFGTSHSEVGPACPELGRGWACYTEAGPVTLRLGLLHRGWACYTGTGPVTPGLGLLHRD